MRTGGHPGGFHPATAVRPEDAPYLLQKDLQNNQTQSDKHSDTQSAEQTPTIVAVENVSESATHSESERALETGSDLPAITVTHQQSDSHSDTNATQLVQLPQVSAVHRVNTER